MLQIDGGSKIPEWVEITYQKSQISNKTKFREQNGQKCYFLSFQWFIIILVTNLPTHVNYTHPNPISVKYELNTLIQMEDISKKVIFAILLCSCPVRTFMSAFLYF